MQIQRYNKARPELNDLFLKPLHRLSDGFGATVLLGEITGDRARERIAGHTDGGGLDMAYGFDLLSCPLTARGVRDVVEAMERHIGDGWICWSFSNHDVTRAVSRMDVADPPEAARKLLPVLLGALRGTLCRYQGEELGLDEAELAFEDLQDPFGITFWPTIRGRDGCRTPMPWDDRLPQAGFTTGEPWLPLPPAHVLRAASRQAGVEGSILEHVRRFLAWRRHQPALRRGTITFLDAAEPVLAFLRELEGARLLCLFNMGPTPQRFPTDRRLADAGFLADGVRIEPTGVSLPGYAAAFLRGDGKG
jgi:alpha-glucosidase